MYVRDYMGLACAINLYVFPLKKTLCTMLFTLRGGETIPCNWKEGYKLSATCVQHSKCTCTQRVRHDKNFNKIKQGYTV